MKNRLMRLLTLAALACCLLIAGVLVACGGNTESKGAHIDVGNGTATAPLGEYEVPIPSVVDESGTVLSGYTVTVSSIKDAEGNDVEYVSGTIIVEEPAVITIVYAAEGVENATLVVTFESEAPRITFTDGGFPSVYLNGNTYYIPAFTAEGADASKTSVAVNYLATESSEPEKVAEDLYSGDPFTVKYGTGYYQFVIHVENKFGTGADYTYLVPLKGPEQTVEGGFIYFEDKFGVEQVASEYGWLDFKYVEAKDLDETMMSTANDAMKAAKGLTHVVFDETLASTTPEAGIVVQNPALTSTGDYAYMYFDVYNAGDKVIPLQLAWSGASRALAPHAWTRVVIELAFVNGGLAVNVSSTDLVGLTLYLAGGGADNYDQEDLKAADIDLYFGNIYFGDDATQYLPSGSEIQEDQVFCFNTPAGVDQIAYRSGITGAMESGRYNFSYVSAETMPELKDEKTGLSGATQILNNTSNKADGQAAGDFSFTAASIPDVSAYAFLALRVYKPAGITGYIGYLREQGITGGGFTQYDLADGWNTVYLSTDHMGACTKFGGRQANAVKLVVGGIKQGESLYFGGAFGIKDEDLAVKQAPADESVSLYPNQSYKPATNLAVAVQDTCAVTWLRGETVANLTYTLSSVTDSTGAPVEVKDGAFVPATTGGTYTLTYSAAFNDGIKLYDYDVVEDVTGKVTVTITTTDPTLDWEDANLPGYYVGTVEYELPDYSVVGVVLDTDEVKVYSVPNDDSELTDDDLVDVSGNTFTVPNKAGYIVFKVTVTYGGGSQTKTFTSPYIPVEVYVEEEGVVAALDQAYGLTQATKANLSSGVMELEFVPTAELPAEVKEGANLTAGATKITSTNTGLDTLVVLRHPAITDVSAYNYMYVDIYNPNDAATTIQMTVFGVTTYQKIRPQTWSRITYSFGMTRYFNEAVHKYFIDETSSTEKREGLTNIAGIAFEFADIANTQGLYIGKVGVSTEVESRVDITPSSENMVFAFDTAVGTDHFLMQGNDSYGVIGVSYEAYSETLPKDEKFPNGTGLTKITDITRGGSAFGNLALVAPYITDASRFESLAIRVYNPNDYAIFINEMDNWSATGSGNTYEVAANGWTTVTLDASMLADHNTWLEGFNGIRLVFGGLTKGDSFYLGAAYGVKADA